jgi:hypothetical protein
MEPFTGQRLESVTVQTIFSSGSRPALLKLNFYPRDIYSEDTSVPARENFLESTPSFIILKEGEDLRRDCLVQTLFAAFNGYVRGLRLKYNLSINSKNVLPEYFFVSPVHFYF